VEPVEPLIMEPLLLIIQTTPTETLVKAPLQDTVHITPVITTVALRNNQEKR